MPIHQQLSQWMTEVATAPDIVTASVLDNILEKCSMSSRLIRNEGPACVSEYSEWLLTIEYTRGFLVTDFFVHQIPGKDPAIYLPMALEYLQAAVQLAQCPEEHAIISRCQIVALGELHRYKEVAKEGRELAGHVQRYKNETTRRKCALLTRPDDLISFTNMVAKAESAGRGMDLYDSAGSLMAEGQHALAAKAARESVDLLPDWTEGYAKSFRYGEAAFLLVSLARFPDVSRNYFWWLPKSRNRMTIPIQRTHNMNIFLF
jgi:hypothetical protein